MTPKNDNIGIPVAPGKSAAPCSVRQVPAFECNDGTIWKTVEEAQLHEKALNRSALAREVANHLEDGRAPFFLSADADEIVDWIMQRYDITPRTDV